jgi:hypothetical protein
MSTKNSIVIEVFGSKMSTIFAHCQPYHFDIRPDNYRDSMFIIQYLYSFFTLRSSFFTFFTPPLFFGKLTKIMRYMKTIRTNENVSTDKTDKFLSVNDKPAAPIYTLKGVLIALNLRFSTPMTLKKPPLGGWGQPKNQSANLWLNWNPPFILKKNILKIPCYINLFHTFAAPKIKISNKTTKN